MEWVKVEWVKMEWVKVGEDGMGEDGMGEGRNGEGLLKVERCSGEGVLLKVEKEEGLLQGEGTTPGEE